jgi:hypothetical protein
VNPKRPPPTHTQTASAKVQLLSGCCGRPFQAALCWGWCLYLGEQRRGMRIVINTALIGYSELALIATMQINQGGGCNYSQHSGPDSIRSLREISIAILSPRPGFLSLCWTRFLCVRHNREIRGGRGANFAHNAQPVAETWCGERRNFQLSRQEVWGWIR